MKFINMRACIAANITAFLFLFSPVTIVGAQSADCYFQMGFASLATEAGDEVGECLESEHFNLENGNAEQLTTRGLMVWRASDNWTAFTNGYETWLNGPNGLERRLNTERLDWEIPRPTATPQRTATPQPTATTVTLPPAIRTALTASLYPSPTPRIVSPSFGSGVCDLVSAIRYGSAKLIAEDGTFLGKVIANSYDSESIINDYGKYGSSYSSYSINNDYGKYGSPYSSYSSFNEYTSTPPKIIFGNCYIYLTKNSYKTPNIDPSKLLAYLKSN